MRPINNVVDISNYVMLETGQPLHFYDLAKIPAREITVKNGLNEMYTALDGQQYHVLEDDIMKRTSLIRDSFCEFLKEQGLIK